MTHATCPLAPAPNEPAVRWLDMADVVGVVPLQSKDTPGVIAWAADSDRRRLAELMQALREP
jgi:hypothetical protein